MKTNYKNIRKYVKKQKACSEDGTIARLKRSRQKPRRISPIDMIMMYIVIVTVSFILI